MFEDVLEAGHVACLHIKHGTGVVLEASHAFNVLCHVLGAVLAQDVPYKTHSEEGLRHSHLEGDAVLLTVEQRALGHLLLVVTGQKSKALAKSLLDVSIHSGD